MGEGQYLTSTFHLDYSDEEEVQISSMVQKENGSTDDSEWRWDEMENEKENSLYLLFDLKII